MSNLIVRKLVNGDPVFGQGMQGFLSKTSATAQKAVCRVRMILGEWFLDLDAGIPWVAMPDATARPIIGETQIAGYAESFIKQTLINTTGVVSIESFDFTVDHNRRAAAVKAVLKDEDGQAIAIEVSFP